MKQKLLQLSTAASMLAASVSPALAQNSGVWGDVKPGKGFAVSIGGLITSLLSFVMVIALLVVFIYLIYGGIQWITAGGDKGKTEEARNRITGAVVGLVVLVATWAIFLIIINFLGFENWSQIFGNITRVTTTGD